MRWFRLSMHEALHRVAHTPQWVHFAGSIRIFHQEKRLINPKNVPTGQMVLQYVRPCFQARYPTPSKVSRAMDRAKALRT